MPQGASVRAVFARTNGAHPMPDAQSVFHRLASDRSQLLSENRASIGSIADMGFLHSLKISSVFQ